MTTKTKAEVKQPAKYAPGNYAADAKIKLLIKGNPKRPGSASAARFAKYKSGMTVAKAKEVGVGPG